MLRRVRGFTLIELMIAVAIVGILASVAYPSYREHVRKGNRAAAQAFMMEVAQRQQSYLINNRSYANSLATLGVVLPNDVSGFYSGTTFILTNQPPRFLYVLTPVSGGMQESDGRLCITESGARTRGCAEDGSGGSSW